MKCKISINNKNYESTLHTNKETIMKAQVNQKCSLEIVDNEMREDIFTLLSQETVFTILTYNIKSRILINSMDSTKFYFTLLTKFEEYNDEDDEILNSFQPIIDYLKNNGSL